MRKEVKDYYRWPEWVVDGNHSLQVVKDADTRKNDIPSEPRNAFNGDSQQDPLITNINP